MANILGYVPVDDSYNRYSMPVTRSRSGLYGADLDQTGTARFLFGEEEAIGDAKYGQMHPDSSFPTLVRREDQMVRGISFQSLLAFIQKQKSRARLGRFYNFMVYCQAQCLWPVLSQL